MQKPRSVGVSFYPLCMHNYYVMGFDGASITSPDPWRRNAWRAANKG